MPGRRRAAPDITAAGGVVWRMRKGRVEVALVHRPRYDDWSLPKGKLDDGETELAAAVREVREEVGSEVAVSRFIASIRYDVGSSRKRTSYWVMRHLRGEFAPSDEIDDVEWLRPKDAKARMTYAVEQTVMADFSGVPIPDSVLIMVRHAKAGKRSEWRGADRLRPLDDAGMAQAQRLVPFLASFSVDRIVSADPVRCVQTVEPFAEHADLDIQIDPAFGDEVFVSTPGATETAFYSLAKPGKVTVIASQGETVPGLIDRVVRGVRPSDTRKAAAWVLAVVDGTVVSADYYEDACR